MIITQENYSKHTMSLITGILPRKTKEKIAGETGETIHTVGNVWAGKQYKKNVIAAIQKHYRRELKKHNQEPAHA